MITAKCFLTAAATLCFTSGCYRGEHREEQVTAENLRMKYAQIQNGMEYMEVVTLLGRPDSSSADLKKGPAVVSSVWNVDLGGGVICHFLVDFNAGKVIAKDMRGATSPKSMWPAKSLKVLTAENVQEKYDQIQNGMELEEILTLLGIPARLRPSRAEGTDFIVGHWNVDIGAGFNCHLTVHFNTGQKVIAKDMRRTTGKDGRKEKGSAKPPEPPKPPPKPDMSH